MAVNNHNVVGKSYKTQIVGSSLKHNLFNNMLCEDSLARIFVVCDNSEEGEKIKQLLRFAVLWLVP